MAVLSCARSWSGLSGGLTTDGRKASADFQEAFQVVHDASDSLLSVIEQASQIGPDPLPRSGDLYPETDSVFVTGLKPQRIGPIMTIFVVSYAGETGPGGMKDSAENSLPEYELASKITQAEVDEDWNGKAIATVNDEPIYGIKRDIVDNVLTVKRKFRAASAQLAGLYAQATNSDQIVIPGLTDIWQPGQAKLIDYKLKPTYGTIDKSFVDVTATIEFRTPYRTTPDKAWYARVRHEGLYARITRGSLEFVARATDDDKQPTQKPVLLDANGFRVDSVADATWLEFQLYDSLPYAALGLF